MTKLPAANEFSPGQFKDPAAVFEILATIKVAGGQPGEVYEWVRNRWFLGSAAKRAGDPAAQLEQQIKRARNVITGMRQYGLLEKSADPLVLSSLGEDLFALREQPEEAFARFASFLLRERHGLEVLEAGEAVRARKGAVSKSDIASELKARGFELPTNTTYPSKMRAWLEPTGVVNSDWVVDQAVLRELAGTDSQDIALWRSLSLEQRAVVEVLRIRALGNLTPIQSAELLDLLRQRGIEFNESLVGRKIYAPLESAGLIERELKTGGRGGKGGLVSLTDHGLRLDSALIDGLEFGVVPADLQAHLSRTPASILADLMASDTATKGVALELLSLRMAADVGLMPAELRKRSAETGGAEVDLVAEGAHLHFSRWLFQCKNQIMPVGLSVLAKELGMATLLRAQVVVIVTTGTFAASVRDFARQASETTAIQIVLLDRQSLSNYQVRGAAALRTELHSLSTAALVAKRPQLSQVPLGGA